MSIKVKKSKHWIFLLAVTLTLGIFGIACNADATGTFRDRYDTAHGTSGTSCNFCHTSAPDLNATGQILLASANPPGSTNFDYCSIGPDTGTCAPAVSAPVINSFTATPASITSGQSSALAWTVSGGAPTALSINGVGSVLGTASTSVSPTATTTYTLTASNSAATVTASVTVTVTAAPPVVTAPVINSFTATPASITSSQSSALAWIVSGGAPTALSINGVGSVLGITSTSVSPTATTTYTLTASNTAGSVTQSVTVTVTAAPPVVTAPVISSFTATANPSSITSGQSSTMTLSWSLSGGTPNALGIDNGVGSVLGLATKTVTISPTTTTTYTYNLTASNSAGTATKQVTVTVTVTAVPPPTTGTPDMTVWVGKWMKVNIQNGGYYIEKENRLSNDRQRLSAYLKITGWDPNNKALQATILGKNKNEQEKWSEPISLHYISGTDLNSLCWSQMTLAGDANYGFTARIRGIMRGGNLVGGMFTSVGGYHVDATEEGEESSSNKQPAGWLKITGRLIAEEKVPADIKE